MNETDQLLHFMITNGISWVSTQREAHRPNARELTNEEKEAMQGFFTSETIDDARIGFVPVLENPDFFTVLENAGHTISLDFRLMSGITFVDTILISEEMRDSAEGRWRPLLFHELVHVVQYKLLGLEKFMQLYVHGWATNGYQYAQIPLEVQAYRLQAEFEMAPKLWFDIARKVGEELGIEDAT